MQVIHCHEPKYTSSDNLPPSDKTYYAVVTETVRMNYYLRQRRKKFACVCLSVCLLARLLKNACMDLDKMLRVDRCRDVDELIYF